MFKLIQKTALLSLLLLPVSTNTTFASEPPANIKAILHDNTPLAPAKVFDNVYCIGTKSVVAWAIKTEKGIILIDAMWDDTDAKTIINGMKKLGLNPEEIKYIIVTHGHGDHYGGANYLRNKYNAKVVMTKVDEILMNTLNTGANSSRSPKTPVDIYVNDGDKITLGQTSVEIVETPGHTPGGISLIFPTTNDGKKEVVAMWGGTGIPQDKELQSAYKNSVTHFEKKSKDMNSTSEITAHLFLDNGYNKLDIANNRKNGESNPFIRGEEGMDIYFKELHQSIDKILNKN
ncbi:MBL fold metallo-hydrolase [Cetobacterium sp. 8H]|uniref:MBL fold metallo-hydrolase n=1 Tax=Cetobacterium sp. 8H TaxID=2759681 RepID=UPI00163CA5A8|nr:MBL fold metallo-hydrolase [Cetobacterium sp. 8H]MBC2852068.1 MBL fold metallo-hydrolase [Cetobacterium sp. 8H]